MSLKFENVAVAGDLIRAFDFQPMIGRVQRYIEGVVLDTGMHPQGFKCFTIRVTKDTMPELPNHYASPYSRVGEIAYVPMGTSMDYDGRIVNLNKES